MGNLIRAVNGIAIKKELDRKVKWNDKKDKVLIFTAETSKGEDQIEVMIEKGVRKTQGLLAILDEIEKREISQEPFTKIQVLVVNK